MPTTVTDAEIRVSKPNTDLLYDFTVPNSDVAAVSTTSRAGERVETGSMALHSPDGRYTTGETAIESDDLVEFWVSIDDDPVGTHVRPFGEGPFGTGTFGGQPARHVATMLVVGGDVDPPKHDATLTLDLEDFVFNRLRNQIAIHFEEGRQIAGSATAHLDSILAEFAADVERDLLPTIDETIDYAVDGVEVSTAVADLARIARVLTGDPVVAASDDRSLVFRSLADVDPVFDDFTTGKGPDSDIIIDGSSVEAPTANDVRVEGGIDDEDNIDDEQTTVDSFSTVTDSTRISRRVKTRKSELSQVEIWTRKISGSEDVLRVRIQADEGGVPVAPGDSDSDIERATADDVPTDDAAGDWQSVRFGSHTLPPQGNPWLLIEADGSDGVEVGVDANSVPAYRAYFPKPVIVREPDQDSQDRYRTHERVVTDEALTTFGAARDRARAELQRSADERVTFSAQAQSDRAFDLSVGDFVPIDEPWLRAEGDFIVTERADSYRASTLETTLTFEGYDSYA